MTKSELAREIKSLKSTLKDAERKRGKHELAEYVERFQKLAELSITLSGDPIEIFKRVAEMIGKLFDIPIVCLSEIRGDMLCFLSVYNKGEVLIDAGQCPISITPCSTVKDSKDMRIYQNVMEKFPKASFLKMHNAFSYCGFPSLDSEGNVISVTCLLDDKSHEYSSEDKDLLQIFAQRIGIEMERKRYFIEQERVKGLLKESDRKYHLLFETANDAIFLANVETGIIIDANKHAEDLLGIPVKEIVGMNYTQIHLPENVGRNIKIFKKHAQIDKAVTSEDIFVQHKDGHKIPVEISSSIFELGGRKVIQGICRDITERKKVEAELKKIFDLSIDMICIAGIDGYFKKINPSFGRTLGYSNEELLGQPFINFVHPDDKTKTLDVVENELSNGTDVINFENRYRCKDGSYKWFMWTAKPVTNEGIMFGIARDITKLKHDDEELKKHRDHLKALVAERTLELAKVNEKLLIEIGERKQAEGLLQKQKKDLEQKNIALSEVLGQIELEKKQIKDNVIASAETLLLPIIQRLRLTGESRKYVQILRKNLQELTSSFGAKLTEKRAKLTSREIEICNMIKNGLTSKEIASILNISLRTAEKHRINIRNKLGIVNKDLNLASFLKTL